MRFDRRIVSLLLLGAFVSGVPLAGQENPPPAAPAATDPPPVFEELKLIAQRAAIPHLSGERPFILRETTWSGQVDPGKARLIQLQLFKRNDYLFWFVVPDRQAALNLNLYNGKGEVVEGTRLSYETPNLVGLMVGAGETGVYYLRVSMQTAVESTQPWTVIYAYR
jgi:hypothetical protein